LPLGPPDEFRSPYRSPSAFAASPQLLARPDARVSGGEVEDFVARHPYWTGSWASFAGGQAIADQVRFEREWGALRSYAADRGFVSYWAIPARNTTAKKGRWRPGPGAELFHAVAHELGHLPVIAEDLGHITPAVHQLRDELGLPGIVVLLWAFRAGRRNPHWL